jgi:hypothetical protein
MNSLSNHAKQELFEALNGKKSGAFVINGKLVSIEIENLDENPDKNIENNLADEIEEYPELKASLERYLNNPEMKRYKNSELKEMRHARRK